MARRSSRGSVYNKRVNEQVQVAKTKKKTETKVVKKVERQVKQAKTVKYQNQQSSSSNNTGGGIIPQAHAQVQSQSQQARTQTTQYNPLARVTQFAHNVGRGAVDTGKSYTTDFYDMASAAITGKEQKERSYQDETLAGAFGRGLFEGNLGGAWDEAGRRITHEPGRVVGEVAAEAAILGATMGFGAALKGARIGAVGVKAGSKHILSKSTAGVSKTNIGKGKALGNRRISGYEKRTSRLSPFNRGGSEFISGDFKKGHTLTIKTNKQGKETAKLTKDLSVTGWTRGITARSTKMGEYTATKFGRKMNLILPVIKGGDITADVPKDISPTVSKVTQHGRIITGDDMIKANKLVDEVDETMTPQQRQEGMVKLVDEVRGWGNTGYMRQKEQFQAGNLGHISGITKQSGLFKGVAAPGLGDTLGGSFYMRQSGMQGPLKPAVKGVLEFNTQVPRIGGTPDNFSNLKIASLDTSDINPQYYKGKDGTYYASKLNDETRPVANKLIKDFTTKIKNSKGLKAARERATNVDMVDPREAIIRGADDTTPMQMMGGSPSSIPIDQNAVLKIAKTEILKTISEGGTEAQATSKVNKIIKYYTSQTVKQDAQVAKEIASAGGDTTATLSSLGTPVDDVGSPMFKFNLVEEIRPSVKTDPKTGGLVKVKYDSEPGPVVFGENYGRYGKPAGDFDDANKAMYNMGGTLEKGGAIIKDEQNIGSQMSNRFDTAADYKASLEYFSPFDDPKIIKQYNIIRTAKPGAKSAHASEQARQSLPANPDQFMMQMGLSKKETKDLFFAKGWGGTVEDAQKEVAKSMNRTPQTGSMWNKKPSITVESVRARKQTELTQGDMSGIKTDPYPETIGKWTKKQITETGIKAPQFVKDKNARITSPGYYDSKTGNFVQEDVESILTAIQFESAPSKAGPRIFQSVDMRNVGFNIGKARSTLRNTRYSGATGKPINMKKLRAKGKKAPKPKKFTNDDLLKIRSQSTKKTSKPYTKKKQTVDDIWAMGKQDWSDFKLMEF